MPEPPSVSLITHYLFDDPWPLSILCGLVGVVLLITLRNTGKRVYLNAAITALVMGVLVQVVERLVTTSGEHGHEVARQLVKAAGKVDVQGAQRLFAESATMSLVDPRNPGVGIDNIRRRLELLDGRYRMKSTSITSLQSYSKDPTTAVVHLKVRSEFESGMGYPVFSAWVVQIERQAGGQWLISRLTFVEYNNGRKPSADLF